jgi:hypothetical protein
MIQRSGLVIGKSLDPASTYFCLFRGIHCLCCVQLSGNPITGALSCRGSPAPQVTRSPLILIVSDRVPVTCQAAPCAAPWEFTVKPESFWTRELLPLARWGPAEIGPPCTDWPRGSFYRTTGRTGW